MAKRDSAKQVSLSETAVYLALAMAAVMPYIDTIRHGYFMADDFAVLNMVKGLRLLDLFHADFYRKFANFEFIRPVGLLSWKANYLIYGFEPVGYHVTNVVLNAVCAFLVFFIASRFTDSKTAGLTAGVFFAVHPAHHEPLNWLSCRYDLLAAMFYLTGFLLYVRYSSKTGKGFRLYVGALLAAALAILSKEMAVTFPLAIALYELFYHRENGKGLKKSLIMTVPFFILSAAYFLLRLEVFHSMGGYGGNGNSIHSSVPSPSEIFQRSTGYLQGLLFGFNFNLPYRPLAYGAVILVAVSAGLAFLLVAGKNRRKALAFLFFFLCITFLPLINFTDINDNFLENSRYLYQSSAVFSVIFAALIIPDKIAGRWLGYLSAVCVAAVLFCYVTTTVYYNKGWVDGFDVISGALESFKEAQPGPLDGLDITVSNLPAKAFGIDDYVPVCFASALYFTYGQPEKTHFRVDYAPLKPHEQLKFSATPQKGYNRKAVFLFNGLTRKFVKVYDSQADGPRKR